MDHATDSPQEAHQAEMDRQRHPSLSPQDVKKIARLRDDADARQKQFEQEMAAVLRRPGWGPP